MTDVLTLEGAFRHDWRDQFVSVHACTRERVTPEAWDRCYSAVWALWQRGLHELHFDPDTLLLLLWPLLDLLDRWRAAAPPSAQLRCRDTEGMLLAMRAVRDHPRPYDVPEVPRADINS